jgi:hypothetical protein
MIHMHSEGKGAANMMNWQNHMKKSKAALAGAVILANLLAGTAFAMKPVTIVDQEVSLPGEPS